MRRIIAFAVFLLASTTFAQLTYDPAKLVYTTDRKAHTIDELGKLFNTVLRQPRPVVLFVHGRGDEPQKSLAKKDGAALGLEEDYGLKVLMYDWESKAASTKDRARPLSHMTEAQERFGMVIDKLGQTLLNLEREGVTPTKITLLAHSMGTIVVERYVEANNAWRTPGGRPLFTTVVICSSDTARVGHAAWVDKIADVERRIFISVNSRDVVLGQSRTANPPNPSPLGKDEPGDQKSQRANVTYSVVKSLNHELFDTGNGRPFFRAVLLGNEP